jgi:hypothetical protein
MAGLLDIFGTGGAETLGLLGMSPADIQRSRDDAQAQALYGLASRLFQGGNTGASIAQGLQQGQQLYKQAMQGQLQEQLQNTQLQDMLRKKKEEQLAQKLFLQGYQPAQAAVPVQEVYGEDIMGQRVGEGVVGAQAAKPAKFDIASVAPQLMALGGTGQAYLKNALEMQKAMGGETFKLGEGEKQYQRDPLTGEVKEVATGAPKKEKVASDIEKYQYAVANDGYKGTFTQFLYDEKRAGASNISLGQKGFDNTLKLRTDFRSEPIYKAHQEVMSANAQIGAGLKAGTPVGDLAAATKIMKLLDPGSVVRESELGMAMAATGLQDRLSSLATNVINGTKLTKTQREQFQTLANQLFDESAKQYNDKRSEYSGIAKRNQLSVEDVVGSESLMKTKPAQISLESRLEKYK